MPRTRIPAARIIRAMLSDARYVERDGTDEDGERVEIDSVEMAEVAQSFAHNIQMLDRYFRAGGKLPKRWRATDA